MKSVKSYLDIPNHTCGVYFLYFEKDGIYIGASKDIRRRIIAHIYSKWIYRIISIEYIITNSKQEALKLERKLINQLKPYWNGRNGYCEPVDKSESYSRIIKPKTEITLTKKKLILKPIEDHQG